MPDRQQLICLPSCLHIFCGFVLVQQSTNVEFWGPGKQRSRIRIGVLINGEGRKKLYYNTQILT
jgi:hypothetical protein